MRSDGCRPNGIYVTLLAYCDSRRLGEPGSARGATGWKWCVAFLPGCCEMSLGFAFSLLWLITRFSFVFVTSFLMSCLCFRATHRYPVNYVGKSNLPLRLDLFSMNLASFISSSFQYRSAFLEFTCYTEWFNISFYRLCALYTTSSYRVYEYQWHLTMIPRSWAVAQWKRVDGRWYSSKVVLWSLCVTTFRCWTRPIKYLPD